MSDRRRQCESSCNGGAWDSLAGEVACGRNVPVRWSDAGVSDDTDRTTLELKVLARILIDAMKEHVQRGEAN